MTRWTRFRQMFGPDPQGDVDDELDFHLAMRVDEFVARGESRARAVELARQRFGEFERTRSTCVGISRQRERTMARSEWIREFVHDVAYAVRTLRHSPGFAAVAVQLTLAVGIGATSAVFSVVHAVLLDSLPYRDADRLYRLRTVYPDGTAYSVSAPDFMSLERTDAGPRAHRGLRAPNLHAYWAGDPREVRGARVSRELVGMLGLGTVLGRPFAADEHLPGRAGVTLLDHGFWVRELGSDPAILGRSFTIGGEPYLVVGALAPGEQLTEPVYVYTPLSTARPSARRRHGAGGANSCASSARASWCDGRRHQRRRPARRPATSADVSRPTSASTFGATPMLDLLVGDARTPLLTLFGAVALVLLVACANVASLLLARGSARRSELAVRAALGAGRGRLVRQLIAEAAVLGMVGGAVGVLLAYAAVRALVWAQPADIPRLDAVAINGTVVLFAFTCAILTALVFGIVPALQSTGRGLLQFVHASGRGGDGGGHRLRGALVVAETTLAVVLLVAAGLLIRSFVELARVDPGFIPDRAVSMRVMLQGPAYAEDPAILGGVRAIADRLATLPGVTAVAGTSELPLTGLGAMLSFNVVGAPPPPANVNAEIAAVGITPEVLARGRRIVDARARSDAR